jgi:hypothetical protein
VSIATKKRRYDLFYSGHKSFKGVSYAPDKTMNKKSKEVGTKGKLFTGTVAFQLRNRWTEKFQVRARRTTRRAAVGDCIAQAEDRLKPGTRVKRILIDLYFIENSSRTEANEG